MFLHFRRGGLNHGFKVCASLGGMSFSVHLTCQGGKATVAINGELPDGELNISGHADGMQRSLGVAQTDAAGRLVLTANSNAYREVK